MTARVPARSIRALSVSSALLAFAGSFVAPAVPAAAAPARPAQEEAAAKTPDELLTRLAAALKERKTNDKDARDVADSHAIETVDQILLNFKDFDDAGKKKAMNAVSDMFSIRTQDGENRIYIAAAAALSEMGEAAQSHLERAMKLKHIEKRIEVLEAIIESLSKHKNPKHVDLFLDLLKEDENRLIIAGVKALSEYRDADGKLRKKIVEGLIKAYANVDALDVREKGKNPVWHERLQAIEVPMNDALGTLTLQSFDTAPKWTAWFNDNRNKKW